MLYQQSGCRTPRCLRDILIDGEQVDYFAAWITTKHFEKEGDSFFFYMTTALVPIDGTDIYYTLEDAENFCEVLGRNTAYVIDPEECMADNFAYAMTYGIDDMEYNSPEIIEAAIEAVSR